MVTIALGIIHGSKTEGERAVSDVLVTLCSKLLVAGVVFCLFVVWVVPWLEI